MNGETSWSSRPICPKAPSVQISRNATHAAHRSAAPAVAATAVRAAVLPVDELVQVADTVVVRPDPVPAQA